MRYGTCKFRSDAFQNVIHGEGSGGGKFGAGPLHLDRTAHKIFAAGLILILAFARNASYAQDTNEIDQLKKQLREMQENFERVQRE